MDETIFRLRYEGSTISEGLDPLTFSDAVKGFADLVMTITEAHVGADQAISLKVHRLLPGSLVLEVLQKFGEVTISDLVAVAANFSGDIRAALDLLKHLGGNPPKALERTEDNRVAVQNNYGQVVVFNHSTVNLVNNGDLGEAAERIARPVAMGQAEALAIEVDDQSAAEISKADVPSMVSVAKEDELLKSESEIWLTATKVVLAGQANWTFSDGRRPFTAPVSDKSFLAEVSAGRERFGNGDRLLVRLKAIQSQRGAKLRTQYEVTRVLRHERAHTQSQDSLF